MRWFDMAGSILDKSLHDNLDNCLFFCPSGQDTQDRRSMHVEKRRSADIICPYIDMLSGHDFFQPHCATERKYSRLDLWGNLRLHRFRLPRPPHNVYLWPFVRVLPAQHNTQPSEIESTESVLHRRLTKHIASVRNSTRLCGVPSLIFCVFLFSFKVLRDPGRYA